MYKMALIAVVLVIFNILIRIAVLSEHNILAICLSILEITMIIMLFWTKKFDKTTPYYVSFMINDEHLAKNGQQITSVLSTNHQHSEQNGQTIGQNGQTIGQNGQTIGQNDDDTKDRAGKSPRNDTQMGSIDPY